MKETAPELKMRCQNKKKKIQKVWYLDNRKIDISSDDDVVSFKCTLKNFRLSHDVSSFGSLHVYRYKK